MARPADRSGITNEVLKLLQDGHYVGGISNTAIRTYLKVIDGSSSNVTPRSTALFFLLDWRGRRAVGEASILEAPRIGTTCSTLSK